MRSTGASLKTCAQTIRNDEARLQRISLIEEGPAKQVRMAHLAIVGTHKTNGVAGIHSRCFKARSCPT